MVKPLYDRTFYCHHNDDERALVGSWSSPELQEAVRKEYRILKIYERWHFSETSFHLFSEYVNTFLKIKQEASGFPTDCADDPRKQPEYIAN